MFCSLIVEVCTFFITLVARCSPWGREESDTTERLHFDFSLSCIGEGNGNPRQCSCLENPRDGGAWWAAVYGVARVRHDWSNLAAAAAAYGLFYFIINDNVLIFHILLVYKIFIKSCVLTLYLGALLNLLVICYSVVCCCDELHLVII